MSLDYEERLEALRIFVREKRKDIIRRDLDGRLALPDLFSELTSLAEAAVRESHAIARDQLKSSGQEPSENLVVVAMGKFGGRELTYHSDLDVIFFYEDPDEQEKTTRLAQRMISALSLVTRNGYAFHIDAALRPSGNSGVLVTSLTSFRDYHKTIGRTWERQALIKARVIIGARVAPLIEETLNAITYQKYDAIKLAAEIDHLRGRMEREIAREKPGYYNLKTGFGGLVDVEFAVQYLQLLHAGERPNLREPNTILALRALAKENILSAPLAEEIESAYLFVRGLETRLRLVLDQPTDELIEGREAIRELERRFYSEPILPRLRDARNTIRAAYHKIFQGIAREGETC